MDRGDVLLLLLSWIKEFDCTWDVCVCVCVYGKKLCQLCECEPEWKNICFNMVSILTGRILSATLLILQMRKSFRTLPPD